MCLVISEKDPGERGTDCENLFKSPISQDHHKLNRHKEFHMFSKTIESHDISKTNILYKHELFSWSFGLRFLPSGLEWHISWLKVILQITEDLCVDL